MKKFKLKDDNYIPALGLGTWQLTGQKCFNAVTAALEVGYRHVDTAEIYGNHREVGQAIVQSGIDRREIFLTSKVWQGDLAYEDVIAACKKALGQLKLEYLDLYLIHWPNRRIPITQSLQALSKLKEEGLIRSIGVSNFTIHHLEDALKTGIGFVVNQVEFHPTLNQRELKEFCDRQGIIVTAYSPLGQGEDLDLPVIQKLAQKYGRSPAQVVLNWLISKKMVAIPKATNPERIKDNFQTLEWQLEEEDIQKINAIGGHNRIVEFGLSDFDY